MGAVSVEWVDIHAYCSLTGLDLIPLEVEIIKDLSSAYVNQLHESKESTTPSPYVNSTVSRNLLFSNHPSYKS
jgi:hypothetical protein